MPGNESEWLRARDELNAAMTALGFPTELGDALARQLGSPKAIRRMTAYIYNEQPKSAEVVVDEALAISEEIAAWREKKAAEEANASYNDLLNYGLGTEEEE